MSNRVEVFREMAFEVVGHLVFAFHAEIGLGVARLPAALLARGALEERDRRTAFERGCRRRHAAHPATHDDYIGSAVRHLRPPSPQPWLPSAAAPDPGIGVRLSYATPTFFGYPLAPTLRRPPSGRGCRSLL